MPFPPESLKDKLIWWILPWFPRRYLVLYDKNGETYEFVDDEISYMSRSENITLIKCKYDGVSKSVAVMGPDPFVYASLYAPSELFGRYTIRWSVGFGFLLYSVFLISAMLNLFNEYLIMGMFMMLIYFLSVSRFRFNTPSVQYVCLHEFGSAEGYQLYVPGPAPQSSLAFSQVMRLTGRLYDPSIKDRALNELMKEIEVHREIVKRLYGLIVRIERQSDKIYDSTYRLARLMASDILDEIREEAEKKILRSRRFWMLIAIIALLIGLAVGYILGQSLGISVEVASS